MFVNFSTDEVYGPAPEGKSFTEFEYHNPSNPYSASKSAQEAIGIAYSNTYKVPVVTTHTMNIIGERQHPEKFVPMVIRSIVTGDTVQIHADATCTIPGSRFYLHARNLADALLHIINQGYHGYDEWNIAGLEEMDNRALAQHIQRYVNEWQEEHGIVQSELLYELTSFHAERPGHDLRYALDSSKLLKSGYIYPQSFEKSLENTVKWSLNNPKWLDLHDWEV
jgi:dTDP-glucose 4,6-dehydratase